MLNGCLVGGGSGAAPHSHPACPLFLYIESPLSWNRRESTVNIWMAKVLNFSRWLPFPRLLSYCLNYSSPKEEFEITPAVQQWTPLPWLLD